MNSILIKNGRVIDPDSGLDAKRDVLIEDGKIKTIKSQVTSHKSQVIDAKGLLVLPGLIDMHAHLRDPGRPDEETIASGTRAAALGGFTTICSMANTDPPADTPAVVKYIRSKGELEGAVNVLPIGAATKGLKGEELAEIGRMREEGAVAFSDDGHPIMKADVMRKALEYTKQFNALIISHCEDKNLSLEGVMNESYLSTILGLSGIPALAEETMIERDLKLTQEFGGRIHIAHVSTGGSVELIRQAKKQKINVTCETCSHYFSLTEEEVIGYNTNAKVNPPLRGKDDVKAILAGLRDGTIDAIATDHAPHTIEEKNIEFNLAAFGIIGLETALSLTLTKLVETKVLTLKKAIQKLTINSAKILNLPNKGVLKEGADADIIIVDPKAEWTVDPAKFTSKSKNTPFSGWKLKGKVLYTIVGGRIVVGDGKLTV